MSLKKKILLYTGQLTFVLMYFYRFYNFELSGDSMVFLFIGIVGIILVNIFFNPLTETERLNKDRFKEGSK